METTSWTAVAVIIVTLALLAWRRYSPTMILILANIIIFAVSMLGGLYGWLTVTDLSFKSSAFFSGDEPWTILTSMFMHWDLEHLLMNTIFLFLIGLPLESRIGRGRFVAVYILGGMAGTLIFTAAESGWAIHVMLAGASGAISALFGAMVMLYPREKIYLPLGVLITNAFSVLVCALVWLGMQLIMYIFDDLTSVAYAAHLGGFAAGAVIAYIIRPKVQASGGSDGRYDLTVLEPLCRTPPLREWYGHALKALDDETTLMWVEKILEYLRCPECGAEIWMTRGGFECASGHRIK